MRSFTFLSLLILFFSCQSQEKPGNLSADVFKSSIESDKSIILLDVRTAGEVARGMIPGAVNIDVNQSDFTKRVANFDPSKTYYIYCLSGSRSAKAASYLNSIGINKTYNLEGGILAWQKSGYPVKGEGDIADKISKELYTKMVNSEVNVLIDFYAPWCAPCMRMEPMLEKLQVEQSQLKIIRVNIDENKKLAKDFGVTEIPIFKFYQSGKEKWEHRGELEKAELVEKMSI